MSNKYQRKVNNAVKRFNRGFQRDIHPYNVYSIRQFKASLSRETHYENMYLLHLYKGDSLVASKWLDYGDIVGFGSQLVGRELFWWVNNAVVESKAL